MKGKESQYGVSVKMKPTSHPVNSKTQQKIAYLTLYCAQSD